jgi:hypothetical protein
MYTLPGFGPRAEPQKVIGLMVEAMVVIADKGRIEVENLLEMRERKLIERRTFQRKQRGLI